MSAGVVRVLSGSGILGYGFDPISLADGHADDLDLVACDAGSTDGGPYYLGSSAGLVSARAVGRDFEQLWECARRNRAPLVFGTCGGSGTDAQLDAMLATARTIADRRGWSARVAVVRSELSHAAVVDALDAGRIEPLDGAPALEEVTVRSAAHIVAMMGTEPIAAALDGGADVVLAGRCSDAAVFAALPILRGVDPGAAWHAGKLLECGATCAVPPAPDCIIAELAGDRFTIHPPNPARRCTPESVMSFTLHETPDPFLHVESNGILDLTDAEASDAGDGKVLVRGARFDPRPSTVRIEGATPAGHRTVLMAATRDPRLIAGIDDYLARTREKCAVRLRASGIEPDDYRLQISVYGRDGVLGPLERHQGPPSHELALVVEVVADDSETARAVASSFRGLVLHGHFEGRQCTEGNVALPFSPPELDGGPVFRFSIWHSMTVNDPLALFPIEYHDVNGSG